jgi:hypothetical protein
MHTNKTKNHKKSAKMRFIFVNLAMGLQSTTAGTDRAYPTELCLIFNKELLHIVMNRCIRYLPIAQRFGI